MNTSVFKMTLFFALLVSALTIGSGKASAHCDTLDGPVITTAKEALKTGDVKPVLSWVQPEDEPYVRSAFEKTLAVRKLSPDALDFADMYFFETLVRLHRAGEGAPYTGLKPAGQVEPPVAMADKAIETGSADQLLKELNGAVSSGVDQRFKKLIEQKRHASERVEAGREFVASYVEFVHYVERLHDNALAAPSEHGSEAAHGHGEPHKN
jgi:hypothetical protein